MRTAISKTVDLTVLFGLIVLAGALYAATWQQEPESEFVSDIEWERDREGVLWLTYTLEAGSTHMLRYSAISSIIWKGTSNLPHSEVQCGGRTHFIQIKPEAFDESYERFLKMETEE